VKGGKLYKGRRRLWVNGITDENCVEGLQQWCAQHNKSLEEINGAWICARDHTKVFKNQLHAEREHVEFFAGLEVPKSTDQLKRRREEEEEEVEDEVLFEVPRQGRKCIVCGNKVGAGCVAVPFHARVELFISHRLVIHPDGNNRLYKAHLDHEVKHLKPDIKLSPKYNAISGLDNCLQILEDHRKALLMSLVKRIYVILM